LPQWPSPRPMRTRSPTSRGLGWSTTATSSSASSWPRSARTTPAELFHSYLWRLNIGTEHQGHGYGRFAVESLCQEAMRRGYRRLTVCYSPDEGGLEGFYAQLGFRPTGEYYEGKLVAERILATDSP